MTRISIWDRIANWAQGAEVPDWQSDAFRRIYEKQELSKADILELGTLLRSAFNVPIASADLGALKSERFRLGAQNDPTHTSANARTVRLVSIGDLKNVNAIVSDIPLTFRPNGLTIVFGYNGSGKTGYSRVLKQACYARDSHADDEGEAIMPDVRVSDNNEQSANKPTATFMLQIDDKEQPFLWQEKQRIAEELNFPNSPIAVFDSAAANIYIIKDNEVPFRPYGLDIMVELANVCDILRDSITSDLGIARERLKEWWDFSWDTSANTEIQENVERIKNQKISLKTSDIEKAKKILASFSEKERERLKYLRGIFKDKDPAKNADALRKEAAQIVTWKESLADIVRLIDDDFPTRLRKAICDFQDAKKIAQNEMDGLDVKVPGSGSIMWNELFTAAEKFTGEIDPSKTFPDVKACVLCQQPMSEESKERLLGLKKFIRIGAGKVRDDKKAEIEKICDQLNKVSVSSDYPLGNFSITAIERIASLVGKDCAGLDQEIQTFIKALAQVKKHMLTVAKRFEWESPPSLPTNPLDKIESLSRLAEKRVSDLENRSKYKSEYDNLEAQDIFARHFENVVNYVNLRLCFQDTDSTKITLKTKELSEEPLNDELTRALKSEIESLGMTQWDEKFHTKSHQAKAKQKAKMLFKAGDNNVISGKTLTKVLSEGEQRTIALASFFAEISLSPETVSSIVFDDPVSSLDHERVIYFVDRLRKEAKKRQVIVFTHDLYFANLFKDNEACKIAVWAHGDGSGNSGSVGAMPFGGISIAERIARLKDKVQKIKKSDSAEQENEIRHGYEDLRKAVEHFVESCLLQNIISRRKPDIKVGNVSGIFLKSNVKTDVANEVEKLHDRASKANTRHREARERAGNPVTFGQFESDVKKLEELREKLANYGNTD